MSQPANANAYLRTKVLTARPEELRLLLIDGAIRYATMAADGLEKKNYEQSFEGFSKCRGIILELLNSIRPEFDPDLCAKVTSLYTFIFNQLVEASHEKSPAKVKKVVELLQYERETWVLLMQQLAGERSGGVAAAAPAGASVAPAGVPAGSSAGKTYGKPAGGVRAPLSVQG